MKIAFIGPFHPYRSGEAQSNTLLAGNIARNRSNSLTAHSFSRLYPAFLYPGRSQKYESRKEIKFDIRYDIDSINPLSWLKVFSEIKKEMPDVVMVTWWVVFLAPCYFTILSLLKLFTRAKICIFLHNVAQHEEGLLDPLLTKTVLKLGDYFITFSTKMVSDLKKMLPEANVKILVEPTYEKFVAKGIGKAEARKRLNLGGNIILFFGLVRKYKGLEYLIRAMPGVLEEIEARLVVVGEFWEDRGHYDSIIEELGIKGSVTVVDRFVSDEEAAAYFCASDVVVLPYISNSYTGVIQVAFGYDRPVIVTDVEGLTDFVDDGKNGLVVPPRDPEALARAIVSFFRSRREDFIKEVIRKKKIFEWSREKEKVLFHGLER